MSLLLLLLATGVACASDDDLGGQLRSALAGGPVGHEVALDEIMRAAGVAWDRCAALAPYTTRVQAEAILHASWPTFSALGLEGSDSFHVFACSHEGRVSSWTRIDRSLDFSATTSNRALHPGSTLRVTESSAARTTLESPERVDLWALGFDPSTD